MRCFVGVWPPAAVRDVLGPPPEEVPGIRWSPPEAWHVTLAFAGDVAAPAVESWTAALGAAAARLAARPEAVLGPATGTLGPAVLCVPVGGLDAAATAVREEAARRGLPFDEQPFVGHLTLARARGRRGRVPSRLVGRPVSARWPVAELRLVRSLRDSHGSRYETVATATVQ
ncbi:MAG: RNA 2',3'-cyclic phosphodiesterase [Acidimicrobiales bacterium]